MTTYLEKPKLLIKELEHLMNEKGRREDAERVRKILLGEEKMAANADETQHKIKVKINKWSDPTNEYDACFAANCPFLSWHLKYCTAADEQMAPGGSPEVTPPRFCPLRKKKFEIIVELEK